MEHIKPALNTTSAFYELFVPFPASQKHLHLCNFFNRSFFFVLFLKKLFKCLKFQECITLGYLQYNFFCIKFCSLNHSFIMVRYTGYRYKDTVKRRLTKHSSCLASRAFQVLQPESGGIMICCAFAVTA